MKGICKHCGQEIDWDWYHLDYYHIQTGDPQCIVDGKLQSTWGQLGESNE